MIDNGIPTPPGLRLLLAANFLGKTRSLNELNYLTFRPDLNRYAIFADPGTSAQDDVGLAGRGRLRRCNLVVV